MSIEKNHFKTLLNTFKFAYDGTKPNDLNDGKHWCTYTFYQGYHVGIKTQTNIDNIVLKINFKQLPRYIHED